MFFTRINPAAWIFGVLFPAEGATFAWFGILGPGLRFRWARGRDGTAGLTLIVFALVVYRLIGHLIGRGYPSVPTFGLPCPTTIFTLGLLFLAVQPAPRWVFVVPVLWAAIGASAAFLLGVAEDLALLVAGALGIVGAVHRRPFRPAAARW